MGSTALFSAVPFRCENIFWRKVASMNSFESRTAHSQRSKNDGVIFAKIGCQNAARFGFVAMSARAFFTSSSKLAAAITPNCGSTGPKLDCLPITILWQEQAIIVPADMAI